MRCSQSTLIECVEQLDDLRQRAAGIDRERLLDEEILVAADRRTGMHIGLDQPARSISLTSQL